MSGMFPVVSFLCICYRTEDYHCVSVSHLFRLATVENLCIRVVSSQFHPQRDRDGRMEIWWGGDGRMGMAGQGWQDGDGRTGMAGQGQVPVGQGWVQDGGIEVTCYM